MRKLLLAALFVTLASWHARAQDAKPAQAKGEIYDPIKFLEERHWKFFFGYDYFLPGSAGNGMKSQTRSQADALVATKGYATSTSNVNVSGGSGARFGALYPFGKHTDLGFSFGYIIGPTMNASVSATGAPGPGGYSINRQAFFFRYIAQGHLTYPLDDRWKFHLGAGAGLATGHIDQGCDQSGSVACPTGTSHRNWTGLTTEISPSVSYHLKLGDLRFGGRYARFPRFRGTDQIAGMKWNTFALFVGATF